MKKYLYIILLIICFIALSGCAIEPMEQPEQPHLYWKNINVVVEEVNKYSYFATVHHYEMNITVYNKEYDLRETFHLYGKGVVPEHWNNEEGDTIKAQLYSWVIDSTNKVVKRKINSLL